MEFTSNIKLPKDRVAVLIGKKGSIKRKIEHITHTKISIIGEGEATISGEDGINIYLAETVIKAIARGFTPEEAFTLNNEDTVLEIIAIKDFTGPSEKKYSRMKARVIGTEGKTRKLLEKMTKTTIVIYGKTIGILGKVENVAVARQAIEKILQGAPHGNAYKLVESRMARTYHG